MSSLDDVVILPGMHDTDKEFAANVARILKARGNVLLGIDTSKDFEDSDPYFRIHLETTDVSGRHVFFISRFHTNTPRAWIEAMLFANAAKIAMAEKVHFIETYCGSSRQEKVTKPGEALSMQAKALSFQATGLNTYTTFSIHSEAIRGFFDPRFTRFDSIPLWPIFVQIAHGATTDSDQVQYGAPDAGAAKAIEDVLYCSTVKGNSRYIRATVIVHKDRVHQGMDIDAGSRSETIVGNVEGYTVILPDDEINSAGTICDGARLCKQHGAKKVIIAAAHGKYGRGQRGVDKMQEAMDRGYVDSLIVTNTCELFPKLQDLLANPSYQSKLIVVPVEPLVADIIEGMVTPGQGYSHLFSSRRVILAYQKAARYLEDVNLKSMDAAERDAAIRFRNQMCDVMLGPYQGPYAHTNSLGHQ